LHRTEERGGAHGALEQCHAPRGGGGERQQAGDAGFAAAGKNDERQFRPGRLAFEAIQQLGEAGQFEDILGDEHRTGVVIEFGEAAAGVGANDGGNAVGAEHVGHGGRISSHGRDDEHGFFWRVRWHALFLDPRLPRMAAQDAAEVF
jgi:hypothetical protein